jgi:hypothetical protein
LTEDFRLYDTTSVEAISFGIISAVAAQVLVAVVMRAQVAINRQMSLTGIP